MFRSSSALLTLQGRTICLAALLASVAVAGTLIAGCGAGNSVVSTTSGISGQRAKLATGKAVFSVNWPVRKVGRLIPFDAESIDVRLTTADGKQLLGEALLVRPSGGGSASTTFDKVPVGAAVLTATAFPNNDGSGVAQATAQAALTVVQNQVTSVPLTMASTIQSVIVTPTTATVAIGQTAAFIATPMDASGNIVLISPSTLKWATSAATIATVDVSGNVAGVALGSATITAAETESGVSGTAAVTVSATPPTPTPNPSPTPTPSPSPASTISFGTPTAISVPYPEDLLAADFDGDGYQDIAVASNSNIVVFYGHGNGTFDAGKVIYTASNGDNIAPRVAADLNHDGKLDLVCSASSSTVYVLLNTGNRNYTGVTVPISGGTKTLMEAVADFDGDGNPDIAAVIESGNVTILKGNGAGGFSITHQISLGGLIEGLSAGDVNGDGKIDLVISPLGGSTRVFLGNGDGSFTPGSVYTTGSYDIPTPTLADVNNDGKLDLLVNDYNDGNMGVLLGNGDGTFQAVAKYTDSPYPLAWVVADLDNDGHLDMVTPNAGSSHFTILHNRGNGLFDAGVEYPSGGSNTRCAAAADFNGDGRPDLVFSSDSNNSIYVVLNTSK